MDPTSLQAARALLPGWVVWAPGIATVAWALLAWGATRAAALLALRPLRRLPADAHWTERARLAQPARLATLVVGLSFTMVSAVTHLGGPLSLPPPGVRLVSHVLVLVAIVIGASVFLERRLLPGPTLRERLSSLATLLVLLYPGLVIALLFALVAGPLRPVSPTATGVAALAVLALAGGGGFRVALRLGLLPPPGERLRRALAAAREDAGGPPPLLCELPVISANAFALPIVGAVGVTRGALRCLDDAELAAVLRHELGHLAEGGRTKLLRFVNAAVLPIALVLAPSLATAGREIALPATFLAIALWLYSIRRVGRRLEQRADEAAHVQAREYASALEKIHRANLVPAVLGRRTTHPDLWDRMAAAGVTPDWPKPPPPPRRRWTQALLLLLVVGATASVTLAGVWLGPRDRGDQAGLLRAVAVRQHPGDVASLGRARYEQGDFAGAATLYLAAARMNPSEPLYPAVAARALATLGRCEEARAALAKAVALDEEDDYVEDVREDVESCLPGGAHRGER